MIELPEALTLSKQLSQTLTGRTVEKVLPPTKQHKFCWYNGSPEDYHSLMRKSTVTGADGFGIYAELAFDNGMLLSVNDEVNLRMCSAEKLPADYRLAVVFDDGNALVFTVAMYGGILLHDSSFEEKYYMASKSSVAPSDTGFDEHFYNVLSQCKPTVSAKAFLATEQRFAGIGNGVLQDILFSAGVHPKKKIASLGSGELEKLCDTVKKVTAEMITLGGRDTEKDLFGNEGGYKTLMSKKTFGKPCRVCGGEIVKEAYLGGSVYYCPCCQEL